MHWGFETSCVSVTKKKSHQCLWHCSIRDSHSSHRPPYLKIASSGDLEHMTFVTNLLSLMFPRSDVRALRSPAATSMLVWKGLGTWVAVLYFGFLFVVVFLDCPIPPLPQEESCQCRGQLTPGSGCEPVHWGRFIGGCLPLCRCERKVTQYLWIVRGLCFSIRCLSNGSSHFY